MGYFVQISNDTGHPLFQATKNYSDVSFASSALFHALVTASLEQGFVPSVLRAQDATIALAVHGPHGARLSIALVTSEFAAGETRDLEVQLQRRLDAFYRGAVLASGPDMLLRQPTEPLRRLLGQRLAPIVARVMAEEAVPGICGRVPCLGLTLHGTAVEWLARMPAADTVLDSLVASHGTSTSAVLSWQGRVLAATPAWRRFVAVDRALLLALAEEVGPATFDQPTRSWTLHEVEHLWLPQSVIAGGLDVSESCLTPDHGNGAAACHEPFGVHFARAPVPDLGTGGSGASNMPCSQWRMINIRIYPPLEASSLEDSSDDTGHVPCEFCRSMMDHSGMMCGASRHTGNSPVNRAPGGPRSCAEPPAASETELARRAESSLVLTLLEEEGGGPKDGPASRDPTSAAELQQSIDLCSAVLRDLWRCLGRSSPGASLLRGSSAGPGTALVDLTAAVLFDELSEDVIAVPPPWSICTALPWQCCGRQRKAAAVRRLMYWMHALPPLGPERTKQYVCTASYLVGAARRDDGLHCWGLMDLDDQLAGKLGAADESPTSNVHATGTVPKSSAAAADDGKQALVVNAVTDVLRRMPRDTDLWTALGGL